MGLIAIIVFLVYAYLGYKLKRKPIAWGFIGLGVLISLPLVGTPFLLITNSPDANLVYWTTVNMLSIIITIAVAIYIAYRNKLIFSNNIHSS
ncbi:hypothetical protein E2R66_10270 [Mucilaginibacter psychrotolerans]|uniref:Uncharacterized protein n=1 Tax=Mucilaginibacter psychrotolerans TaxID=1524096 RepID=A0A4Y8SGG1_9SPHI|nr:hypothetical protein E2R66_10270 [Mucilaginibacter psychrotolerans]